MVDSPTQPKPILAIVIPNCVAAIDLSIWSIDSIAISASLLPSFESCESLVLRTETSANSDATKNPFAKSKNTIKNELNNRLWSISISSPAKAISHYNINNIIFQRL